MHLESFPKAGLYSNAAIFLLPLLVSDATSASWYRSVRNSPASRARPPQAYLGVARLAQLGEDERLLSSEVFLLEQYPGAESEHVFLQLAGGKLLVV